VINDFVSVKDLLQINYEKNVLAIITYFNKNPHDINQTQQIDFFLNIYIYEIKYLVIAEVLQLVFIFKQ
jgi:hypothetical protein